MEVKDLVVVQADGTFVHDRASGEGIEAKAGIVYSKNVQVSKGRRLLLDKQTYAGVEEMQPFGEKLSLLAARQGAYKPKQLSFVSDGSHSLRKMRQDHFPSAVYFLDLWHLEKRLGEAFGEEGKGEVAALITLAVAGKVDQLFESLTHRWAQAGQDDLRRELLANLVLYVDANREGIANYARYGARASGAIEKTMDVTVGRGSKPRGLPGTRRARTIC